MKFQPELFVVQPVISDTHLPLKEDLVDDEEDWLWGDLWGTRRAGHANWLEKQIAVSFLFPLTLLHC